MTVAPSLLAARKTNVERAAQELFGYSALKPSQLRVIEPVLAGRDTFAVLPTSEGKSACYQLPALVLDGLTVVISPLVALMKDQVDKLTSLGVAAARFSSDVPEREQSRWLDDMSKLNIAYVSPERLKGREIQTALVGHDIGLIAVDEAHCLSRWGQDFRPSYGLIGRFTASHPNATRLALTATATADVEFDVARVVGLRDYARIIVPPTRDNLKFHYSREMTIDDLAKLVTETRAKGPGSILVYCASRRATEDLAVGLRERGIDDARYYHAGMEPILRSAAQQGFMNGTIPVLCATTAFGMGVDKPDIRLVVHWHQPGSVFAYLQEAGRAGRDGLPSDCWLNISNDGRRLCEFFTNLANPPWRVYDRMWEHFLTHRSDRYSTTALARKCGVPSALSGQIDAALAFLEFTGHIETSPGTTIYRLPVRNASRARNLAMSVRGARFDGNHVVYTVEPGGEDRLEVLLSGGACAYAPPEEVLVIRRLSDDLSLTESAIDDKRARATTEVMAVEQFARTADKARYVERYFLGDKDPGPAAATA